MAQVFNESFIDRVCAEFFLQTPTRCWAVTQGLINKTYVVELLGERFIVQWVNSLFHPDIQKDIEALTQHLKNKGLLTPEIKRSKSGDLYVPAALIHADIKTAPKQGVFRVLTFIEGTCVDALTLPGQAYEAGALVGRFHRALLDFDHLFVAPSRVAHDTKQHMQLLMQVMNNTSAHHAFYESIMPLGQAIIDEYRKLLPISRNHTRVCHGDLKISNLMFNNETGQGICLLDLDTIAPLPLCLELGDAWRSWCNPQGEDQENPCFDLALLENAIRGYFSCADFVTSEERASLLLGVKTITLELAARFCADIINDCYFGFNAKFGSRAQHNLIRARGQLSLFKSVQAQQNEIERLLYLV